MDAQKASYSITLMANVLGVTRAGYYAWKNRAPQRGKRASARRRLDEAVAWEHEVSGGTYGAPRIRHALARAGVDVGVRAVAASMRRQGLTGLNTHPRPSRRGGRGPVAHEDHCARQWDQGALDRVWITDFTYLRCAQGWVYLCAVRDAHSRRVLGYAMGEQQSTDLVITALDMAATTRGAFPAGVVLHADRGTQFTSEKLAAYMRAVKGRVSMGRPECAGITPWPNPFGPPSKPSTTTGVPSPPATRSTPGSPPGSKTSTTAAASTPASAANPPSNTNYTKRPGQKAA